MTKAKPPNNESLPTSSKWMKKYSTLKESYQQSYVTPPLLGSWVTSQRTDFKKGTLLETRIDLLNAIGFDWDPMESNWMNQYNILKQHYQTYGHCHLPFECPVNHETIIWMRKQRTYKNTKALPQKRVDLLNAINFDWDPIRSAWIKQYHALKSFYQEYGHCQVSSEEVDNKQLSTWVQRQKLNYHQKQLSQEYIDLLNAIEFSWAPTESRWMKQYQVLKALLTNKTEQPTPGLIPSNLHSWCVKQRQYYKHGTLDEKRIDLLNTIGFDWDPLKSNWMKQYTQVKNFYQQAKQSKVEITDYPPEILSWVERQRIKFNEQTLSQDHVDLLNAINFNWNAIKPTKVSNKKIPWQKQYDALKQFHHKHAHCHIPYNYPPQPSLPRWIEKQRFDYSKGTLEPTHLALLNALNFSWHPIKMVWLQKYQALASFYEQHRHTIVSLTDSNKLALGIWTARQREAYKKAKLNPSQIKLLEDIHFDWHTIGVKWTV
tara:strand:- start:121 stop:1581 length:1461 start_codon:yes stop_codon:yes gene_type:complete